MVVQFVIVASAFRPFDVILVILEGALPMSGDQDVAWLIIRGLIILQVHVLFSF